MSEGPPRRLTLPIGYSTAILAHLIGPEGRIHAFVVDPDLAARATANLVRLPRVSVEGRSGIAANLPSADAIYLNAAVAISHLALRAEHAPDDVLAGRTLARDLGWTGWALRRCGFTG